VPPQATAHSSNGKSHTAFIQLAIAPEAAASLERTSAVYVCFWSAPSSNARSRLRPLLQRIHLHGITEGARNEALAGRPGVAATRVESLKIEPEGARTHTGKVVVK
jgi:hypothetical protein